MKSALSKTRQNIKEPPAVAAQLLRRYNDV
nr:MAG TPA: hypothetical protein [Caudoviricetes sp.]